MNRETGIFSVPGHPLEGTKLSGKILVCDFARGGVAAGWALNALKANGFAPLAIIFKKENPVMVQGSIFANITIAEGLNDTDFNLIESSDLITIDPVKKTITLEKNLQNKQEDFNLQTVN